MKGHQREASYATQEHGHKEILFKVEQHAAQTVKSNFPYHIVNILAFQKKNIVNILFKIFNLTKKYIIITSLVNQKLVAKSFPRSPF
jgi:hypothetical protein